MSTPSIRSITSTTITVSWVGAASSLVIAESPVNTTSLATVIGTYIVTSDINTYSVTYNTKLSNYYRATVNYLSGASSSSPLTQYQQSSTGTLGFSTNSNALNIENSEMTPEIREDFGLVTASTPTWDINGASRLSNPTVGDALLFTDGNANVAPYMVMSLDPFNSGTETSIESKTSLRMPFDVGLGVSISQRTDPQIMTVEAVSTDKEPGLPTTQSTSLPQNIVTQVVYNGATATIHTATPHRLVPGQVVTLYGMIDPRANLPGVTVERIPQPTQFTVSAGILGNINSVVLQNGNVTFSGGNILANSQANAYVTSQTVYVAGGTVTGSTSAGVQSVVSGAGGVAGGITIPSFSPGGVVNVAGTSLTAVNAVPPPQTYTLSSSTTNGITTVTTGNPNNFLNLTTAHGLVPGMTVALTTSGSLATSGIGSSNIYTIFSTPTNVYPITSLALQPSPPVGNYTGTLSIVNAATVTASTNTIPLTNTTSSSGTTVTSSVVVNTNVTAGAYIVTGFNSGSAPLTMNTTLGLAVGMPIRLQTAIGGFAANTTLFIQAVTGSSISLSSSLGDTAVVATGPSESSTISLAYAVTNTSNGSSSLTMNSTHGLVVGMPINFITPTSGFTSGTTYMIQAITSATAMALSLPSASSTPINASAGAGSSLLTIPYTSQSNLAIDSNTTAVITFTSNHGLVVGNKVVFARSYGGLLAGYPYWVLTTNPTQISVATLPNGSALTLSVGTGLAAGNFTAYCTATATTTAIAANGVVTISGLNNNLASDGEIVFGAAVGGGTVIGNPYFISGAPASTTSIVISPSRGGLAGQFTLSTSATIPSPISGQIINYGRGNNSFPNGAIVTIYGTSALAGKQYYITFGAGTQILSVMPVSANDTIPVLSSLNDTLIIVPTGSFIRLDHISERRNGSCMSFASPNVAQAQFATRYENDKGVANVSGTIAGFQGVNIAGSATNPVSTVSSTAVGTYSFAPSTQFNYSQQVEGITWSDFGIDGTTNHPTLRFKRNQHIPNPSRSYNLRFKALNLPNITRPGAVIKTMMRLGSAQAMVTTETAHGLTVNDIVLIHGSSDQTNTPNLVNTSTSAATVLSIPSSTSFIIGYTGATSGTVGCGGFVARIQGGRGVAGLPNVGITGISKSLNIISVTVSAAFTTLSTGDYVNLYGVRATGNGGGLPIVNNEPVSLDGIYRYIGNPATNVYSFDTLTDIYGDARSPTAALSSIADFANIPVGGSIIRRTDYRLHFVRANERKRLIVEPNQARNDSTVSIPVSLTSASTVALSAGTVNVVQSSQTSIPVIGNDINTSTPATFTFNTGLGVAGYQSGTISPAAGVSNIVSINVSALVDSTVVPSAYGVPYNADIGSSSIDVGVDESDDSGTNWYRVYDFPRISSIGWYRSPKIIFNGNRIRYTQVLVGGTSAAITRLINRLGTSHNDSTTTITTKAPNTIQDYTSAATGLLTNIAIPSFNPISGLQFPLPTYSAPNQVSFTLGVTTYVTANSATDSIQINESYDNGLTWVPFYKFYPYGAPTYYTSPKFAYNGNILQYVEALNNGATTARSRFMLRNEYIDNNSFSTTFPSSVIDVQSNVFTSPNERSTIIPVSSGTSCTISVPVTAISNSAAYDLRVEESDDGGVNWNRLYDFPRISTISSSNLSTLNNASQYRSPKLAISGNRLRYTQSVTPSLFTVGTGTATVTGSALVTSSVQNAGAYTVSGFTAASPTVLTLNTTTGLAVGLPIQFSTSFGTAPGIVAGTTYYIATIPNTTTITLVSGNATAGTALASGTSESGINSRVVIPYISQVLTTALQASNVIVTRVNHNLVAGNQIIFTSAVFGLTAGTLYYVATTGLAAAAFSVSASPGGAVLSLGANANAAVKFIANCTATVTATNLPTTTTITLTAPLNILPANAPIIFGGGLGSIAAGTIYYINGQPTAANNISIATSNSVTRSIIRQQTAEIVPTYRQLIEKATNPASGSSISLTTSGSTSQTISSQNAKTAQLIVAIGGAATGPTVQLDGSDDFGASWYAIGTAVAGLVGGGAVSATYSINSGHLRARVSAQGTSVTNLAGSGNYVAIKVIG